MSEERRSGDGERRGGAAARCSTSGELARREGEPPLDLDALQRTLDPERLVEETREQIEESGEESP